MEDIENKLSSLTTTDKYTPTNIIKVSTHKFEGYKYKYYDPNKKVNYTTYSIKKLWIK